MFADQHIDPPSHRYNSQHQGAAELLLPKEERVKPVEIIPFVSYMETMQESSVETRRS